MIEPLYLHKNGVVVRTTQPDDLPEITRLSQAVYPGAPPWRSAQIASHLEVFPEGQLVAVEEETGQVLGMAASLVVSWDDYEIDASWRRFTDSGWFTNHDLENGRTLYGAEVMVRPDARGRGVGALLYEGRREIVRRLGLRRIRAGARLSGYAQHSGELSPAQYVMKVVREEIRDPTLSFQLGQDFSVLAVVDGYLADDPESLGHAAVIEWLSDAPVRE